MTDWELRPRLREDVSASSTSSTYTVHQPGDRPSRSARCRRPPRPRPTPPSRRAHEAFPAWRDVAPGERARLLRAFAAIVDATTRSSPSSRSSNAGHTIGNARWEAGNVRDVLNYYSAAPERLFGKQIPVAGGVDITFHEPLGVVGVIVPWNFPMPIAGWGFAPALAAGNTVVLKPAEITPLTAIRHRRAGARGRHPPEASSRWSRARARSSASASSRIPTCARSCFTGSTEVGKQIMAGCAEQVKQVTLELGGKSANIVFADADIAAAAAGRAGRRLRQRRPGLLRPLADPGRALGVRRVPRPARDGGACSAGDSTPADEASEMGPMVSAGQRDSVQRYVDGATVAFSAAPDGPGTGGGFWLPPMVVESTDVDRAGLARGGVRAGGRGDAVRRRGRGGRAGQRHRVRAVRVDLHPRPRPGAARRARRRGREPQRELATRACATGRRSAATSSPASAASSARTRRTRSPRRRTSSSPLTVSTVAERPPRPPRSKGTRTWQDASRAGWPSSPAAARGSGWRPYAGSSRRAPRSSSATSTTSAGHARRRRARRRDARRTCTSTSPTRRGRRALQDRQGHLRLGRHRVQQRRASARPTTTRSSTPSWTPGGGCRRST